MIARSSVVIASLCFSTAAFAQADFSVPYASQPSSMLYPGDIISISWEVANNGSSSGDTTIGFVIDNGTDAWLIGEEPVTALAAFGYTTGTMTLEVPSGLDGVWYAGMVADPFNMLVETDEMDNVFLYPTQITIGTPVMMEQINVIVDTLPPAREGVNYSATLRQTGGTAPNWYVSSGSLPSGLSLSSSGQISGVPRMAGVYTFIVNAEQSGYLPGSGSFTINVSEGMSSIVVTPTTLPEARIGVPYETGLQASGGSSPYGFQLLNAPSWLSAVGAGEEAGTLRGMPDGVGHFEFSVYVVDSAMNDATVTLTLDVVEAGTLMISASAPGGVTGQSYESTTLVSGGIPPYNATVSGGSLPPGLSLDARTALLSGVPSAAGDYNFEVQVTDANSAYVSGAFQVSITEVASGLTITSRQIMLLAGGTADVPLTVSGGVPPYTWQMVGGMLPQGVSFDSANNKLIGKPTLAGMSTATFSVTDSQGMNAQADVVVTVDVLSRGGGAGGGGSRRSGCACVAAEHDRGSYAAALLLAGVLAIGVRRRYR